MSFYSKIIKIFWRPICALYRIKVNGLENLPEEGHAALLVANHTSLSDCIVMVAASKLQIRFMAKAELFKTPLKPLISALGAYPIDRKGADVGGIKKSIALLKKDRIVGIFPQGHRNKKVDPRLTNIKSGIGMIVSHAQVPIVPVFIDNKGMKTRMFKVNTITFGKPIPCEELEFDANNSTEYLRASRIIFRKICEIKYGPAETWDIKTQYNDEEIAKTVDEATDTVKRRLRLRLRRTEKSHGN